MPWKDGPRDGPTASTLIVGDERDAVEPRLGKRRMRLAIFQADVAYSDGADSRGCRQIECTFGWSSDADAWGPF